MTLAEAVEHAHSRGVLHRDLKPANILLTRVRDQGSGVRGQGRENDTAADSSLTADLRPLTPKIADFGLAKLISDSATLTQTGATLGTPSYMAPEQALGDSATVGPTADVYALGAILYECLTGRPPFQAPTPLETLEQVRTLDPVPLTRLQPKVPRDLETICLKCLQKEPGRRYGSARELSNDLDAYLSGKPIQARRISNWERGKKWAYRRPAVTALTGALALVIMATVVAFTVMGRQIGSMNNQETANAAARYIALARSEWLANRMNEAQKYLQQCDRNFQDAEWTFLWRATNAEAAKFENFSNQITAVTFNPGGTMLAIGVYPSQISLWSIAPQRQQLSLNGIVGATEKIGFSPDGTFLAQASVRYGLGNSDPDDPFHSSLSVWKIPSGSLVTQRKLQPAYRQVEFTTQGSLRMKKVRFGKPFEVICEDVLMGKRLQFLAVQPAASCINSSATRLAACDLQGVVTIYDLENAQKVAVLEGSLGNIHCVAISGDGRLVAQASSNKQLQISPVTIWSIETGRRVASIVAHGQQIRCMEFSRDGKLLATGSLDQTAAIWDVAAGSEWLRLRGHNAGINCLAFDSESRYLATGSLDNTVRIWRVRPD
jgi:hypothetical protein